jgi:hypothetical protein
MQIKEEKVRNTDNMLYWIRINSYNKMNTTFIIFYKINTTILYFFFLF